MARFLLGFKSGLFGFDTGIHEPPVSVFPGLQPLSVAVDPADAKRLYCASYNKGVWRSEDAGQTWLPIGTPQDYFGPRVNGAIDTCRTTFVSVGPRREADGRHAVWVGTEPSRLYHSTDHGETFELVSPLELPSRPHWSFPPRPDTHHVQCIAHGADGSLHMAIEAGAMLRSREGSSNFEDRLPDSPIDTHVLLTHRLAPGRLYAALGDGLLTPGRSFAESHDNGESWRYLGLGLEAMPYLYGLAINPADPDEMLVAASSSPRTAHALGGSSIFRRTENSWIEDAKGFPSDRSLVPALSADPGEPGRWFALSDQGLFVKEIGADTWTRLTTLDEWRGIHPTTLTVLEDRREG